jgi:hypothetical protein
VQDDDNGDTSQILPGVLLMRKIHPAFSNTNLFCCYQTHKTRQKAKSRIRDIGELYLRILFCTYIFIPPKRGYLPVKTSKQAHQFEDGAGVLTAR